jgi:polyisoprenoid-binding protein YceI
VIQKFLRRPQGRIALGSAIVIVAIAAGAFYLFGTGGAARPSKPVTAATVVPTSANQTVFTIDPSTSQATFTIDEVLFGQPNTVVGSTSQVAGQILVDMQNPSQSHVGQIRIDLSTLVTDNDLRTRTLQNRILETGDPSNQYATFVQKSLSGLPSTVSAISVGKPVSFQITGDLTIHHVTRTVTFTAQVTAESATLLKGQAQATVKYADFRVSIPSVPSVTGVSDTVKLALTFTAHA